MKTLCLDFDGVLHAYTSGWKGEAVIPDGPVPGAMAFLADAIEHFNVSVYSTRSRMAEGRKTMADAIATWLFDEGMDPMLIEYIDFPNYKPAAFLTIDDRAMTFQGTFPRPETLLDFKTWQGE